MTKNLVPFVLVLLLSGTAAIAGTWADNFGTVDTDGSGTISRAEWNANEGKLDPTMNPTFTMMDKDGEQQRRYGRMGCGGRTEDGHRQGMYVVLVVLVSVPEQS